MNLLLSPLIFLGELREGMSPVDFEAGNLMLCASSEDLSVDVPLLASLTGLLAVKIRGRNAGLTQINRA